MNKRVARGMIVTRPCTYNNRAMVPGDRFEAYADDVRLVELLGWAKPASSPPPKGAQRGRPRKTDSKPAATVSTENAGETTDNSAGAGE